MSTQQQSTLDKCKDGEGQFKIPIGRAPVSQGQKVQEISDLKEPVSSPMTTKLAAVPNQNESITTEEEVSVTGDGIEEEEVLDLQEPTEGPITRSRTKLEAIPNDNQNDSISGEKESCQETLV